jgi:predicted branched-subunit amino acid permease
MSLAQTCVLSALMFSGSAQFGFVGVVGAGGAPFAGVATGVLLASRNSLYGLHLSGLLRRRGLRRAAAAHLVIDESAAMSMAEGSDELARLGFWRTGLAVFCCWNVATVLGAVGARFLSDPGRLGLDAVAPAAFVALMAPRLRSAPAWFTALVGGGVALAAVPVTPAGTPVLLAAAVIVGVALRGSRHRTYRTDREAG